MFLVLNTYVDREKAKSKRGKIGIEHANIKDIQEALMHVSYHLKKLKKLLIKVYSLIWD